MKKYRFSFKVRDRQFDGTELGTLFVSGKSYGHARYRAERQIHNLRRQNPDAEYTLLRSVKKSGFDRLPSEFGLLERMVPFLMIAGILLLSYFVMKSLLN